MAQGPLTEPCVTLKDQGHQGGGGGLWLGTWLLQGNGWGRASGCSGAWG